MPKKIIKKMPDKQKKEIEKALNKIPNNVIFATCFFDNLALLATKESNQSPTWKRNPCNF